MRNYLAALTGTFALVYCGRGDNCYKAYQLNCSSIRTRGSEALPFMADKPAIEKQLLADLIVPINQMTILRFFKGSRINEKDFSVVHGE